MSRAIPIPIREQIVHWCQSGRSLSWISKQTSYTYAGVAKIWRRFQREGESSFQLAYVRCGRPLKYGIEAEQAIEAFIESNPALGAPYIRSKLLSQGKMGEVPHERTIQRMWRRQGKSKPRGRRPRQDTHYTQETHHTWQVDGKELVTLSDGEQVSYLSFADEASGGFLKGVVFPPLPSDEVRQ